MLVHLCRIATQVRIWSCSTPQASIHLQPRTTLLILGLFVSVLGLAALLKARQVVLTKALVKNTYSTDILLCKEMPNFVRQDPGSPPFRKFAKELQSVIAVRECSLASAIEIRKWVRNQQADDPHYWEEISRHEAADPGELLRQQRMGVSGACRRFSYILTGALLSFGFCPRMVAFTQSLRKEPGFTSHVLVEIWVEDLNKWVLLDPTFDTLILVDNVPASALELYTTIRKGGVERISFERNGSSRKPCPSVGAFAECCGHLFVASSNAVFNGSLMWNRMRFLHMVDEQQEPYPTLRKRLWLGVASVSFALDAALSITLLAQEVGIASF